MSVHGCPECNGSCCCIYAVEGKEQDCAHCEETHDIASYSEEKRTTTEGFDDLFEVQPNEDS